MASRDIEHAGEPKLRELAAQVNWVVPPEREKFFDLKRRQFLDDLKAVEQCIRARDPLGVLFHLARALDTAFRKYAAIPQGLSLAVPVNLHDYRTFKTFVTDWKKRLMDGPLEEYQDEHVFSEAFAAV